MGFETRDLPARAGAHRLAAGRRVPVYTDSLLAALGASHVEALDASNDEGATRLHDLNEPIPAAWHGQFDLGFAMLLRRHRRIFSLDNRAFYQPADLRI